MANESETKNTMIELTRGGLLARNTLLNIVFQAVPLLAALITIPIIIKGLGTDRFGILSIAWMVMGYFSLFDLGLGRALIKFVGEKLARDQTEDIPALFWTSLLMMSALSIIATIIIVVFSKGLVYHVLKIPEALKQESLSAFIFLGCSVPIVITSVALWGVMEARQKFLHVNIVRTINGLFTMILPVVALHFTTHIGYVVLFMMIGRFLLWFVSFAMCMSVLPVLKHVQVSKRVISPLLKISSWMAVSNIVGPLMVYFDRFLIGAIISVAAVAYYVTPYEVVTKLLVVAVALNRVLFPAFSASHHLDPLRTAQIYNWGRKAIFSILFPVILIIIVFAFNGMELWVGKDFAQKSSFILQCLAIGVFFNAPAQIALSLIQASGRPDLTAKLHLVEAPLYFAVFWFLIHNYGIKGAAAAWTLRVLFDANVLFIIVKRLDKLTVINRIVGISFVISFFLFVFAMFIHGFVIKLLFLFIIFILFFYWIWFKLFPKTERAVLKNLLKKS